MIKQYPLSARVSDTGTLPISTRVLEAGSGNDIVLCIHGVGSRADRFRPTLGPLAAAGYHAYAIDLPGHGFATKGDLPLGVPYYARYVAAIAEQLPAGRLTMLGTSLGGNICGYLPRVPAARLDRLVMIGTLGVVPIPPAEALNISRVILRNRSIDDCTGKLRALLWDSDRVTREWAEEESAINNSEGAEATFARLGSYFEDGINNDLVLEDVKALSDQIPVANMWGDRDVIVSVATGKATRDALPGVPFAWVRDTGHAPYWERPQDFVAGMEQVLDPATGNLEFTV